MYHKQRCEAIKLGSKLTIDHIHHAVNHPDKKRFTCSIGIFASKFRRHIYESVPADCLVNVVNKRSLNDTQAQILHHEDTFEPREAPRVALKRAKSVRGQNDVQTPYGWDSCHLGSALDYRSMSEGRLVAGRLGVQQGWKTLLRSCGSNVHFPIRGRQATNASFTHSNGEDRTKQVVGSI